MGIRTFTLSPDPQKPVGSIVGVYLRSAFPAAQPLPVAGPGGVVAVGGGAIGADGRLAITGLDDLTDYVVWNVTTSTWSRFKTGRTDAELELATFDPRYAMRLQDVVGPILAGGFAPPLTSSGSALAVANNLRAARFIMPRDGVLRDLFACAIAPSAGLVIGAIYDTGDALAGSRTRLWQGAQTAIVGAPGYQPLGDPQLAVRAGQHLDIGFIGDAGGILSSWCRVALSSFMGKLPFDFPLSPGGAKPVLTYELTMAGFAADASFVEPAASSGSLPVIIARLA